MAYTLNTSHALYGNLVELFGVQSGALVSHKTARTFTKHADATYGTGTYGEHFAALAGGYTAKGASFTPYLTLNTSTKPNYTVVAVVNSSGAVQGGTISTFLSRTAGGDSIRSGGKDSSGNAFGYRVTGATMGTGTRMITYCRIGETAAKLYNNTTLDVNSTGLGADYNSPDSRADYLCGWDGQNSMTASLVWLAVFDKELTSTEITDLYNSLGSNNAFGLVESAAGSNGTATGTPDSIDLIAPTATAAGTGNPDGTGAGAPTSLTLTVPSATATGTSSGTDGTGSGAPTAMSMAAPSASATGTTSGSGTLVTPVLKNNTGTVLASETGITVNVYNATTGALVLHKTGQTSNGSGIVTVIDAALTPATTYAYEVVLSGGARRLPTGIIS